MIRRPPRPPLFPNTTLSQSGEPPLLRQRRHDERDQPHVHGVHGPPDPRDPEDPAVQRGEGEAVQRSEEHTSELQSRQYLVCRLLLEKKTNTHIGPGGERAWV